MRRRRRRGAIRRAAALLVLLAAVVGTRRTAAQEPAAPAAGLPAAIDPARIEPLDLAPGALPTDSFPRNFVAVGDQVFFTGSTPTMPCGLYRIANAGTAPQPPELLRAFEAAIHCAVRAGSRLLFVGYASDSGYELWTSDGTAAGTHVVTEVAPGPWHGVQGAWSEDALRPFRDGIVFLGEDAVHGRQLWFSDGTAGGTHVLSSFPAGSWIEFYESPSAELDGVLYVVLRDDVDGSEIWATDGTPDSAWRLTDVSEPLGPRVTRLAASAGRLWFVTEDGELGDALWWSDGTVAGTVRVPLLSEQPELEYPSDIAVLPDGVLLVIAHPDYGADLLALSVAPGSSLDEAPQIREAYSRPYHDREWFEPVGTIRERVVFIHGDWGEPKSVWASDGSRWGTDRLFTLGDDEAFERAVGAQAVLDGRLLFVVRNDVTGSVRLHATDGTEGADTLVAELPRRSAWDAYPDYLDHETGMAASGRYVYLGLAAGGLGWEPWVTDGTAAGTRLVANLAADLAGSNPEGAALAPGGGVLLGSRGQAVSGSSIGFAATSLALPESHAAPVALKTLLSIGDAIAFGSALILPAYSAAEGVHLVVSDATPAGTRVLDRLPATPIWGAFDLTLLADRLFFVLDTAPEGSELWATDGSPSGARMVTDLDPAPERGSDPRELTPHRGRIWFTARVESWVRGLYATDGTEEGTTVLLPSLRSEEWYPEDAHLTSLGERLLFVAETEQHGLELFASDGTPEGTGLLRDLRPGPESSRPYSGRIERDFVVRGDRAFFVARVSDDQTALWVTDGTEEGTRQLTGPAQAAGGAYPFWITPFGDGVLFTCWSEQEGRELWTSDGTPEGTRPLADVVPGPEGSDCRALGEVDGFGLALLSAWTPEHGRELWVTDGTAEGTRLVVDLAPGVASSAPQSPVVAWPFLLFSATDERVGSEWRRVSLDAIGIPTGRVDADDDSWPDVLEEALGTNARSAEERPGAAPLVDGPVLADPALRLALRYDRAQRDSLSLSATLAVPEGTSLEGQQIAFDVGGVVRAFTLDAKGRARDSGGDTVRVRAKTRKGRTRGGPARVRLRCRKGTLAPFLYDEALGDAAEPLRDAPREIAIRVVWRGTSHDSPAHPLRFTRKPAKKGTAR